MALDKLPAAGHSASPLKSGLARRDRPVFRRPERVRVALVTLRDRAETVSARKCRVQLPSRVKAPLKAFKDTSITMLNTKSGCAARSTPIAPATSASPTARGHSSTSAEPARVMVSRAMWFISETEVSFDLASQARRPNRVCVHSWSGSRCWYCAARMRRRRSEASTPHGRRHQRTSHPAFPALEALPSDPMN